MIAGMRPLKMRDMQYPRTSGARPTAGAACRGKRGGGSQAVIRTLFGSCYKRRFRRPAAAAVLFIRSSISALNAKYET